MTNLAESTGDGVYLRTFLAPLQPWLSRSDVTEILINRPGEIWVETNGRAGMDQIALPELTTNTLQRLASQVARTNSQGVNRSQPLLSGLLPGGARIQIICPPATRQHIAVAIRKHVQVDIDLQDYAMAGAFADVRVLSDTAGDDGTALLREKLGDSDILGFLESAIALRKNILIAGGTSSGKTTFLNALLKRIPPSERLIVIEDTPEVSLHRPNAIGLVAVRGETGESNVSSEELLQASLRMRPDRLLLGEMRGAEALSFLRAINTGHPGSISTIHADSPKGAMEQIALLALQAKTNLNRQDIVEYARSVLDIIIQLKRAADGRRVLAEIALVERI